MKNRIAQDAHTAKTAPAVPVESPRPVAARKRHPLNCRWTRDAAGHLASYWGA